MTADFDALVEKAARVALRDVPIKVLGDHEQVRGGCKCGAQIGDGIDWKWHVANQTTIATVTALAAKVAAVESLPSMVSADWPTTGEWLNRADVVAALTEVER